MNIQSAQIFTSSMANVLDEFSKYLAIDIRRMIGSS